MIDTPHPGTTPNVSQAVSDFETATVGQRMHPDDRYRVYEEAWAALPHRFDLNKAINEVIVLAQSVITDNGASIQTQLMEGLYPVQVDRVQLQQAILNLIVNAVKAMRSVDGRAQELLISAELSQASGVLVAMRVSGPGIDPEHLERAFEAPPQQTPASAIAESLSAREGDILKLIAEGLSNKEIARNLAISPETVKSHVKHIFTKLNVQRRVQVVSRAQSLDCGCKPSGSGPVSPGQRGSRLTPEPAVPASPFDAARAPLSGGSYEERYCTTSTGERKLTGASRYWRDHLGSDADVPAGRTTRSPTMPSTEAVMQVYRERRGRRFRMNFPCKLLICGFLCCLLATRVQAQEAEQGESVFCDTQVQIEQFTAYYEIQPISEALQEINRAAPHACEPLLAAFIRGDQVKAVRINQGTVHLYEVLVVGVWRGKWGKVDPTIQYIGVLEKEEGA